MRKEWNQACISRAVLFNHNFLMATNNYLKIIQDNLCPKWKTCRNKIRENIKPVPSADNIIKWYTIPHYLNLKKKKQERFKIVVTFT